MRLPNSAKPDGSGTPAISWRSNISPASDASYAGGAGDPTAIGRYDDRRPAGRLRKRQG